MREILRDLCTLASENRRDQAEMASFKTLKINVECVVYSNTGEIPILAGPNFISRRDF